MDLVNFAGPAITIQSNDNVILSNDIGVLSDGSTPGPNGLGVQIEGNGNTIGGTATGAENVIADNSGDGVDIKSGNSNAIRQNAIFGVVSPSLAIDLEGSANGSQGAPIIQSASSLGNVTSIQFQLGTNGFTVNTPYTIEFFASSASGQAQSFLGSVTETPNSLPISYTAQLPTSVAVAQILTATATAAGTSELSNSLAVSNPFVVTTTLDNPLVPVVGSLRQVILSVDANPPVGGTTDPITFDIPTSDPGYKAGIWTISLTAALPPITVPVSLDATSQGTLTTGPLIRIDGRINGTASSGDGLVLASNGASSSSGSTIKGLDLFGFGGAGIHIETADNLIINDVIGTSPDGSTAGPGNSVGVLIDNVGGNTIGGTTAGADIIGANTSAGVSISGAAAIGNLVANNFIGTNTAGAIVGNGVGVAIVGGASANTIGTNVIAANATGVSISDPSTRGNVVAGNFIGTNSGSATNLGNATGILIAGGSTANTVGGTTSTANVIVSSTGAGVSISGATTSGNLVAGNFIGTDSNDHNLANAQGIAIDGAASNTIGGITSAAANLIDFNSTAGMSISGSSATGNLVAGNFIGTDATGTAKLGNATGVIINIGTATTGNTIGGTVSGAGNVIAANTHDAVDVSTGSGNAIRENLIYGNGGGIFLAPSANNKQFPPSQLAVASVPNLTTIDFTLKGTVGQSYTVDFFATNGTESPAGVFLGTITTDPLTAGTQGFTVVFPLSTPLLSTQSVTATATGPDGSTSSFATTAVEPVSSFLVTNTTDNQPGSEVGSLRQAILDADSDKAASGTDNILFALTGGSAPYTITPTSALPAITVPVTVDGTHQLGYAGTPVIAVDGGGQAFDGLVLGVGSDGSTIKGLSVFGFGNSGSGASGFAGIHIVGSSRDLIAGNQIGVSPNSQAPRNGIGVLVDSSSNNTIGGSTAGAQNTIESNIRAGITVLSGDGNVISENLYAGTNGTTNPVEAADIGLAANANGNESAPVLSSASLLPVAQQMPPGNSPLLRLLVAGLPANVATTVEFYEIVASPAERLFLGSEIITPGSSAPVPVTLAVSGLSVGDALIATATLASNGTSAFSAEVQVANGFSVTNTNDSGFGSLEQAIEDVDADRTDTKANPDAIQFLIPTTDPGYDPTTGIWTIALNPLGSPLNPIDRPVIIDATTQPGYYDLASLTLTAPAEPMVEINGNAMVGDGLVLAAGSDGSSIIGLSIYGFRTVTGNDGAGIDIQGSDDTLAADWIGLGSISHAGNSVGVLVNGGSNNAIGAADIVVQPPLGSNLKAITLDAESVISGNQVAGILIENGARNNQVQNSFIGSDVNGQTTIANGIGVEIVGSSGNYSGGYVIPSLRPARDHCDPTRLDLREHGRWRADLRLVIRRQRGRELADRDRPDGVELQVRS